MPYVVAIRSFGAFRESIDADQAFIADPEWQQVFQESRADGPLISGLESVFLDPTDFSPLR